MSLRMKYFVLKPGGHDLRARASRAAMRRYAELIRFEDPEFATGLCKWCDDELEEDIRVTGSTHNEEAH